MEMEMIQTEKGYEFNTPCGRIAWEQGRKYTYKLVTELTKGTGKERREYIDESIRAMFEKTDCLILFCHIYHNNLKSKTVMGWFLRERGVEMVEHSDTFSLYKLTIGTWSTSHGLDPSDVIAKKPT